MGELLLSTLAYFTGACNQIDSVSKITHVSGVWIQPLRSLRQREWRYTCSDGKKLWTPVYLWSWDNSVYDFKLAVTLTRILLDAVAYEADLAERKCTRAKKAVPVISTKQPRDRIYVIIHIVTVVTFSTTISFHQYCWSLHIWWKIVEYQVYLT